MIFIGSTVEMLKHNDCLFVFQIKYKGNMKTEISSSLYSLLPETTETQFVKELTEILSEVRHDGGMEGWREGGGMEGRRRDGGKEEGWWDGGGMERWRRDGGKEEGWRDGGKEEGWRRDGGMEEGWRWDGGMAAALFKS